MVHRPNAEMFHKQGFIITTACGAGMKKLLKILKKVSITIIILLMLNIGAKRDGLGRHVHGKSIAAVK